MSLIAMRNAGVKGYAVLGRCSKKYFAYSFE
jgi:hypothetical protein